MSKVTYYERILAVMQPGQTYTFDQIVDLIEPPASDYVAPKSNKTPYIGKGLGTGISAGTIVKIVTPGEKRIYNGHSYRLAD
jgi:hypothetical protein